MGKKLKKDPGFHSTKQGIYLPSNVRPMPLKRRLWHRTKKSFMICRLSITSKAWACHKTNVHKTRIGSKSFKKFNTSVMRHVSNMYIMYYFESKILQNHSSEHLAKWQVGASGHGTAITRWPRVWGSETWPVVAPSCSRCLWRVALHVLTYSPVKMVQPVTLWWTNIAMEKGHRNRGFSH